MRCQHRVVGGADRQQRGHDEQVETDQGAEDPAPQLQQPWRDLRDDSRKGPLRLGSRWADSPCDSVASLTPGRDYSGAAFELGHCLERKAISVVEQSPPLTGVEVQV
jgi:hypothetical protein